MLLVPSIELRPCVAQGAFYLVPPTQHESIKREDPPTSRDSSAVLDCAPLLKGEQSSVQQLSDPAQK